MVKSDVSLMINYLSSARACSSLGEMSLIDSGAGSVTVQAKSDAKIAVIDLEYLATVFSENPRMRGDIAINIAKILSKRLRQATEYAAAKTGLTGS